MSDSDAQFLVSVLEMHSALLFSFNSLADPGGLTKAHVAFDGFDGNDNRESVMLGFTSALSETWRWDEVLAGRTGFNSRSRTMPG